MSLSSISGHGLSGLSSASARLAEASQRITEGSPLDKQAVEVKEASLEHSAAAKVVKTGDAMLEDLLNALG